MDPNDVSFKIRELNDRSRWNDLRIYGIEETSNKTWEDCEIKIQELIKKKLKIKEHIEIDRCDQISKKKKSESIRGLMIK